MNRQIEHAAFMRTITPWILCIVFAGCGDDDASGGATRGLGVPSSARACDVLLVEGDDAIAEVTFGDSVNGTFVREAPNVAISFAARDDSSISASAIELKFVGDSGDAKVSEVECANSKGNPIKSAKVSLK